MNPLELRQTLDEYQLHWRNVDSTRQILGGLIILTFLSILWIAEKVWNYHKYGRIRGRVPKMPNIPRDRVYRR